MSPNAYLQWKDRLLCGYQGESEHEQPNFMWTYSTFEDYINEYVTPSMYHFMAGYVQEHITKHELYEIQGGDYCPGDLEAEAVDAYFALPLTTRMNMHDQELANLRALKRRADDRESAAIDAMLEENKPFTGPSPISKDYADFMRGIIDKSRRDSERFEREIYEEENWWGEYAEDKENGPRYDHADEH